MTLIFFREETSFSFLEAKTTIILFCNLTFPPTLDHGNEILPSPFYKYKWLCLSELAGRMMRENVVTMGGSSR